VFEAMDDSARFRQVLGHFPTGVVVITAAPPSGPVGMSVGSFTSVSLEPPLVGFLPGKASASWPAIEEAGVFGVNILGSDQEELCRVFASKADDKFTGVGWKAGVHGAPLLDGVLAHIECGIESVAEAGDHWWVVGRVLEMVMGHEGLPLVFFRGGYGSFVA
jgi:3-hydroxy-9,10-secoandrosta-1,3,5(10)-triene-9,17-dione monooxygenase reductase component